MRTATLVFFFFLSFSSYLVNMTEISQRRSSISSLSSYSDSSISESSSEHSEEQPLDRQRLENIIMYRVTHHLDPTQLPGILAVIEREEGEDDEVEIDLSKLTVNQLEHILSYVDTCIHQNQMAKETSHNDNKATSHRHHHRHTRTTSTSSLSSKPESRSSKSKGGSNQVKNTSKRKRALHRRRLLENMLVSSSEANSSDDGEPNIIVFDELLEDKKLVNHTIVHESKNSLNVPERYAESSLEDSDEVIDIML
jgi:DNA primase